MISITSNETVDLSSVLFVGDKIVSEKKKKALPSLTAKTYEKFHCFTEGKEGTFADMQDNEKQ